MEIWKDIPGYEWYYQISNLWNVKSFYKWVNGNILSPNISNVWYFYVNLFKKWKSKTCTIHRLVAIAFIPNPENKPQVNHIDWNKLNNSIGNLEWITNRDNTIHAFVSLWRKWSTLWVFWSANSRSKKINQYDLSWNFIKMWGSLIEASEWIWVSKWNICSCCKWKRNHSTAWGFIWKYA